MVDLGKVYGLIAGVVGLRLEQKRFGKVLNRW